MTEHSKGGIIHGTVEVEVMRGPRREAVDPVLLSLYEDECIINRHIVCIRKDPGHASLPIPDDRFWQCPTHGDPS
jgi:hypothetical protein